MDSTYTRVINIYTLERVPLHMNRRVLLGAISGSLVGFSGYLSVLKGDEDDSGDVPLREITFVSTVESEEIDSFEVVLKISWDGELVHEDVYEVPTLDNGGGLTISSDLWPDGVGVWEISAKVEGGEWRTTSSDRHSDDVGCVRLIGSIDRYSSGVAFGWAVGRLPENEC